MVKLVSAIEVARTILRRPEGAGRMACSCSSCGSSPCSGAMMMSGLSRLSLQLSFDTPDFRHAGKEHQQAAWFHGQRLPDASHDG